MHMLGSSFHNSKDEWRITMTTYYIYISKPLSNRRLTFKKCFSNETINWCPIKLSWRSTSAIIFLSFAKVLFRRKEGEEKKKLLSWKDVPDIEWTGLRAPEQYIAVYRRSVWTGAQAKWQQASILIFVAQLKSCEHEKGLYDDTDKLMSSMNTP